MKYTDFLGKYLGHNPEALLWTMAYGVYCHAIDDIIDNEIPKDKESKLFIVNTFQYSAVVFSNGFYLANIAALYPLVKMAFDTYQTSIELDEQNRLVPERWKKHFSDCLRQTLNEVILRVIELVNDLDTRKKAALELYKLAYIDHHTESGEPI